MLDDNPKLFYCSATCKPQCWLKWISTFSHAHTCKEVLEGDTAPHTLSGQGFQLCLEHSALALKPPKHAGAVWSLPLSLEVVGPLSSLCSNIAVVFKPQSLTLPQPRGIAALCTHSPFSAWSASLTQLPSSSAQMCRKAELWSLGRITSNMKSALDSGRQLSLVSFLQTRNRSLGGIQTTLVDRTGRECFPKRIFITCLNTLWF